MLVALNLLLALGGVALIHGYLNKREKAVRAAGPMTANSASTLPSNAVDPGQGEATKLAAAEHEGGDSASPGNTPLAGTATSATPNPASTASGRETSGAGANDPGTSAATTSGPTPARARIDAGASIPKTRASPDAGVIRPKPPADPKPKTEPASESEGTGQPSDGTFSTPPPSEESPEEEQQRLERMYSKISLVVSRHQTQLSRCYESAAKATNPSDPLEGKIRVQFAIHPDGVARSVGVVSNNTGSTVLSNCIVGLVGSWTFPSSGGDALEFVWPFDFQAVK